MKKGLLAYGFLIAALLLTGCAQMGEPTGGAADAKPPEIIPQATFPANRSVNFTAGEIVISFNEYIQLKSPQLVITPAMNKKPQVSSKGKKLYIKFREPLDSNTTYTINLSGMVTDITENNPVQNMQYVFSTGTYLDSLSISGQVNNAFTQKGIGATTVILHTLDHDTAITKVKPAYFLKTEKDGSFRFNNLKQGHYRVYALADKNTDLLYNGHPEEIGFSDSVINLTKNTGGIVLNQFKPLDIKTGVRLTYGVSKWVQVYRLSRQLDKLKYTALNPDNEGVLTFFSAYASDSVFYARLTDTLRTDTLRFILSAADSIVDTLAFTSHLNKKTWNKPVFNLAVPGEMYITDSICMGYPMPVEVDPNLISITDTLNKKPVTFTVRKTIMGVSVFPAEQMARVPLKIVALPGAFKPVAGAPLADTLTTLTTYVPVEKMGAIKLTIQNADSLNMTRPVCVLLLDNKEVAQQPMDGKTLLSFDRLKPGNYTLYIYDDADRSKQWTPGNFYTKTQPEAIRWNNQAVKVKANWEQNITWIL